MEKIDTIKDLMDAIPARNDSIEINGLGGPESAWMIAQIFQQHHQTMVIVTASAQSARQLLNDLNFFGPDLPVTYFPPYNLQILKNISYHSETAAKRIKILYQLTNADQAQILVTTIEGLLQKLLPCIELIDYIETITNGKELNRDNLIAKLISGGYTKAILAEEPGDYCVRGDILDIFSPLYPEPVRIEQFGDTVEALRFFSPMTQRKTTDIPAVTILPAREAILQKADLHLVLERIQEHAARQKIFGDKVRSITERITQEGVFAGIGSMLSLFYHQPDTFFDYLPAQAVFMLIEPTSLMENAETIRKQLENKYRDACDHEDFCVAPQTCYLTWQTVEKKLSARNPLITSTLPRTTAPDTCFYFKTETNAQMTQDLKNCQKDERFQPLTDWINIKTQSRCLTMIVCSSTVQAERLTAVLTPYGLKPEQVNKFPTRIIPGSERVKICIGELSSGFEWSHEGLALITDGEIFGVKRRRSPKAPPKIHSELLTFTNLKSNDLVVHIEHGIGRYQGLVKLNVDGLADDFLLITYRNNDKLYLPVDRMSMIQKYMGVDDFNPVLDQMGGTTWEKVKARTKKSVEKIAGALLKIFTERKIKAGYAFNDPGISYQEFEAGFPYEETSDQARAIEDVLEDMNAAMPMDRLVCGDVGYGKTEVALRASFWALHSGKQVAVLVPTTVLAEQHTASFQERYHNLPVKIACLSRFRSIKEQRTIINELKQGTLNIVIGTHRLLQKDIAFKELGLIVLDEEQRFGVKHKEKLKQFRSTVDVLALTATPIPRTLHMSMLGIRDISVISTPPEHRHTIMTYISEFDDKIIIQAIRKELGRGGQIFFVHNRVKNIQTIARHLSTLVPEVRFDVAHGRMPEDELEKVMLKFFKKEIDLLVCTTIIESGLDVPDANTIIINRADRFGLSQIYQLRGRVGRSDEQAYAYLFIPHENTLGKKVVKRLKVLMEHSDLGSGFQIAMSDLKIRGGGTILGASQSGHIAAVGYDMFLKLMENSMAQLKGETVLEPLEPEINIPMPALIPASYIPDIDQRLSIYKRLAEMQTLRAIADFKIELSDRFGRLPDETGNLLLKIMLKVMAVNAGVKRLDLKSQQVQFWFSPSHQKNPGAIVDLVVNTQGFKFTQEQTLQVSWPNPIQGFAQTKNILKDIAKCVN